MVQVAIVEPRLGFDLGPGLSSENELYMPKSARMLLWGAR